MPRGKPFQPGNTLGRGRPKDSRNKRNRLARALLEEHGEALVRKAMLEALRGDVPLLRSLLGFLLPRWKEAPIKTGPLPIATANDVRTSVDRIFEKVSTGELSLPEARHLAGLFATRHAVLMQTQYEARLEALESILAPELDEVNPEVSDQAGSDAAKGKPRGDRK